MGNHCEGCYYEGATVVIHPRPDCPGCPECKNEHAALETTMGELTRTSAERNEAIGDCERLGHQLEQAAKAAGIEKTECERLRAELLSVRESLQRERAGQVRCNAGHISDRALWDCPVCVEYMRARLAKAERVVKAVGPLDAAEGAMANAYSHKQVTEAKAALLAARIELEVSLEDWERENG